MSDISDVQTALVNTIVAALYPTGTSNPSVSNSPIVVYAGWPSSAALDADLAVGKTHVTVFPKAEERNTTRYPKDQQVVTQPVRTLTLTVSGQVVTVGGSVSTPQNVALLVNGLPYVYPVGANDTLAIVAASLAALVGAAISGTSASGAVITVGSTGRIEAARVGASGTVASEVRRQEKNIMITVWSNAPGLRDQIGAALDVALAQIDFLPLPDGFGARLIYKNTLVVDALQKETLYRRDFNYSVEYPTTVTTPAAAIVIEELNITGGIDPTAPVIETIYS